MRAACLRDSSFRMPTANEKKALWFLAVVALSGSAVRLWRANQPPPVIADAAALDRQIGRVDSVRSERHAKAARRGAATSTDSVHRLVDLDRASAEEIEVLPGIGPALSRRIVAARDSAGGFGGMEGLCAVSGVGPALVKKLLPLVTFSGPHRPLDAGCGDASKRPRRTRSAQARQAR